MIGRIISVVCAYSILSVVGRRQMNIAQSSKQLHAMTDYETFNFQTLNLRKQALDLNG